MDNHESNHHLLHTNSEIACILADESSETSNSIKETVGEVIRPLPEEFAEERIEVRYNSPTDSYERPLAKEEEQRIIKGWRAMASAFANIGRKVEQDWKMVYLSRSQKSPADKLGYMEWTIDLSGSDYSVSALHVMASGAEFESGKVQFTLCGDNDMCVKLRGLYVNKKDFKGCKRVKLRAEMRGGEGENAWQHAQLFRQKDTDFKLFPLDIVIDLHKD